MEKTAVVFYSVNEDVKNIAYDVAKKRTSDVFCLNYEDESEARQRCKDNEEGFKARPKILGGGPNLSAYSVVTAVFPLHNGYPPTLFNTLITNLPVGKDIEVLFVSEDGNSEESDEKTVRFIERSGLNLLKYKDIKSADMTAEIVE